MANKHNVVEAKQVNAEYLVNVYCVHQKMHVMMTLEKSVRDTIKNHGAVNYGVPSSKVDEDKKVKDLVLKVFKQCGYRPLLNKDGNFKPSNGTYWFEFVK